VYFLPAESRLEIVIKTDLNRIYNWEVYLNSKSKMPLLRVEGISKHFGGVIALKNIDMELMEQEILGIVGDNGAGKSTLVKIISGAYQKDAGEIYFEDKRVEITSPDEAKRLGIEIVYQDLALIDSFDTSSNIFLTREIKRNDFFGNIFGLLNYKKMRDESVKLLQKLKLENINLHLNVSNFSGGQRQAIALSKAVYWGKKIVILDEPTAALGVKESKYALSLIRNLKKHGISIIIISHNLQHIFSIVDRIMVLRRGEKVGIKNVHQTNADEIVSMITGAHIIQKI